MQAYQYPSFCVSLTNSKRFWGQLPTNLSQCPWKKSHKNLKFFIPIAFFLWNKNWNPVKTEKNNMPGNRSNSGLHFCASFFREIEMFCLVFLFPRDPNYLSVYKVSISLSNYLSNLSIYQSISDFRHLSLRKWFEPLVMIRAYLPCINHWFPLISPAKKDPISGALVR